MRITASLMDRIVEKYRSSLCFSFSSMLCLYKAISITVKIVPESLGCVSDQPRIEFACATSLESEDILAVYIPYQGDSKVSFTVNNPNSTVWTADLNGDGIADIACVSATFEGISSDTLAEVLWFVNIQGTWQIIDWGQDLDCT